MTESIDVVVVGASFAGLACASALADAGRKVVVLERKKDVGQGIHTTGIVVKEAIEGLALPPELTHPINQVALYAPNLRKIGLRSDSYFFLATDTPSMMRFIAERAEQGGVIIRRGAAYRSAERQPDGTIRLDDHGLTCRFLVGADGPRSAVAQDFGLGRNRAFLVGAEAEFPPDATLSDSSFSCFLTQRIAPGYIGWVVPGPFGIQVGLACRDPARPDLDAFLDHIRPVFDFDRRAIVARRGGLIPVGGVVRPSFDGNVFLTGDAAGLVSPFSGGGIHTADHFGRSLADYLIASDAASQSRDALVQTYPGFRLKHLQRKVFESATPDWALNALIGNPLFGLAARIVFFSKKHLRG